MKLPLMPIHLKIYLLAIPLNLVLIPSHKYFLNLYCRQGILNPVDFCLYYRFSAKSSRTILHGVPVHIYCRMEEVLSFSYRKQWQSLNLSSLLTLHYASH